MEFAELDPSKIYSYADYLQWTFKERLELIKGKIFKMTPAPASVHQRISWRLSGELYSYLKNKSCEAFTAPFDVRLPGQGAQNYKEVFTVVQPDLCIICDLSKVDKKGCTGPPDIIVEILSPGNNQKELRNKYEVYEEAGVQEYWIISPQDKTFLKYTLTGSVYSASRLLTFGDKITSPILPGFDLELEILFADV